MVSTFPYFNPHTHKRNLALLDDEKLFHIRSFHPSRRYEPNRRTMRAQSSLDV
jgi:hypothetical protein